MHGVMVMGGVMRSCALPSVPCGVALLHGSAALASRPRSVHRDANRTTYRATAPPHALCSGWLCYPIGGLVLRPAYCSSGTNSATVGERPRGGMYSYRTSRTRNPDRSPETQPNS